MSIAAIVRALVAAKATPEMILAAVEAAEGGRDDALERRRQNDRDRKARQRGNEAASRDVTGSHNDRQRSSPRVRVEDNLQTTEISGQKDISSPSARSKRASRLPADWQLPDEWLQEAVAAGLPRQRALAEAERMKNWSLSAKNGAKLDWLAAWRNWFRDKLEAPPRQASPPKPMTVGQMFVEDARQQGFLPNDKPTDTTPGRLEAGFGGRQGPSLSLVVGSALKNSWSG